MVVALCGTVCGGGGPAEPVEPAERSVPVMLALHLRVKLSLKWVPHWIPSLTSPGPTFQFPGDKGGAGGRAATPCQPCRPSRRYTLLPHNDPRSIGIIPAGAAPPATPSTIRSVRPRGLGRQHGTLGGPPRPTPLTTPPGPRLAIRGRLLRTEHRAPSP